MFFAVYGLECARGLGLRVPTLIVRSPAEKTSKKGSAPQLAYKRQFLAL